ncbi:RagB/SusD family nutrient uptake outer membrane protein [Niabella sp. CJ426]|uniref:RagB/SusD family nutrient uptake outer membrane protein n=1 Tax=Niabella sp. CJ426 TaxID=3393740 RepID=UPI003CFEA567
MKYKWYKIFFLLPAFVIVFTSCSKFLERPPEGNVEESEALKTEDDVKKLLNGCYRQIGISNMYNGQLQATAELLGDALNGAPLGGKPLEIFNRSTTIFNTDNADLYTGVYYIIYTANKVLEHLDLVSDANRAQVEGEAQFIRAICHFEVARLWAHNPGYTADNSHPGIPLRTSSTISAPVRASVAEVYRQIIADLKSAEGKVADYNATKIYADKNIVRAFLAKVYFQMNSYTEAYNYANLVISSGKYTLQTTPATRYTPTGTPEAIFITMNQPGTNEPGSVLRGRFSGTSTLPNLRISQQLYDYVTGFTGDKRIAWLNTTKYAGNIYVNKYDSVNFVLPIVSLTEMYLVRAESAAEQNTNLATGIADINKIIERAYGNATRNISATSSAGFLLQKVREQREIEMIGEGDRLHQIKRIGADPNIANRVEILDRRRSPWNCPGFILQFPDYEKNANKDFELNIEGGCL